MDLHGDSKHNNGDCVCRSSPEHESGPFIHATGALE